MISCDLASTTSTARTRRGGVIRLARIAHRVRTATLAIVACVVLTSCAHRGTDRDPAATWAETRQLVLVATPDWDATDGTLRAYTRVDGTWVAHGAPATVAVGRSGSAWGLGLHPAQRGAQKREGDGRAPAGVFAIGEAFGYAPTQATALRYQPMTADDWCIDVPESPLYNRIVDAREVGASAIEGSTEPMRRDIHLDGDQRYRRGFVIAHNADGTAGAGSCIFAHLWQTPGQATAGCTAMPEPAMQALLGWLDPAQRPVFVLLPEAELARLATVWRLPVR